MLSRVLRVEFQRSCLGFGEAECEAEAEADVDGGLRRGSWAEMLREERDRGLYADAWAMPRTWMPLSDVVVAVVVLGAPIGVMYRSVFRGRVLGGGNSFFGLKG